MTSTGLRAEDDVAAVAEEEAADRRSIRSGGADMLEARRTEGS
jgi:hypothetical protein